MKVEYLILLGGCVQLGVLLASALVPGVLQWRTELARLPKLLRQLIWVHGVFIVLVIAGFGVLSILNASSLAAGSMLARSLCAFIALFWGARLLVQWFVFDASGALTTAWLKAGYHFLTLAFGYLTIVYALAAVH